MKTRIIHTKIWDDSFFINLSKPARYLFLYLITNHLINLCGIYELPERNILFETSFSKQEFDKLKKELEPKIFFNKDWVYVVNSKKLGGYKGKLCEEGINRELQEIPEDVKKAFDKLKTNTPYIPLEAPYKGQEIINNKQEIINKKEKVKKIEKKFKFLTNIPKEVLVEFSEKYNCSEKDIISKGDDLSSYCQAKGRDKGFYKDYKALLRKAVKTEYGLRPPKAPDPHWMNAKKEPRSPEVEKKIAEIKASLKNKFKIKK